MKRFLHGTVAAAAALAGIGVLASQSTAESAELQDQGQGQGQVEQFTIRFESVQPEGRIKTLLQQHSLIPFAVFMTLDDQYGRHYVGPSKANLQAIDQARSITRQMEDGYGRSLAHRAKLASEGKLPAQAQERIAAVNTRRQNRVSSLDRGRPIIYGLWVTGSKASADAIARVPGVTVVSAHDLNGRAILEDPKAPVQ
jgi:hypothetical protein